MASWGPGLFQDDIAQDVRDTYKDKLRRGNSSEEVTDSLINEYGELLDDSDDAPIFWFALADTQWGYGRLSPIVKEKAIDCIDSGTNQNRWLDENPKDAEKRAKILEHLKQKLNEQQPPERNISQYKLYKCEWEIGDVFAYKLESDLAKEKGFFGRYLLLWKVDEGRWSPGHIVPVVYALITQDDNLPKDANDISKAQFIRSTFARRKTEYQMLLLSTSKRIIPSKKLKYIGNYKKLDTPNDEYIVNDKLWLALLHWKDIETQLINRYLKF